jgi:predicted nucleic acid-binding protein
LDTAPLIYFIEESPEYLHIVRPFFQDLDAGDLRVVTSVLTLTEVLVHPLPRGDSALANHYRRVLLQAKHLDTVAVSNMIAESAAELRSNGPANARRDTIGDVSGRGSYFVPHQRRGYSGPFSRSISWC